MHEWLVLFRATKDNTHKVVRKSCVCCMNGMSTSYTVTSGRKPKPISATLQLRTSTSRRYSHSINQRRNTSAEEFRRRFQLIIIASTLRIFCAINLKIRQYVTVQSTALFSGSITGTRCMCCLCKTATQSSKLCCGPT